MNPQEPDEGPLSPAEMRLRGYLAALGGDAPAADPRLPRAIVRTARWQRAVRVPLRTAGLLAAAVVDGVGLVLGVPRRRP